MRRWRAQVRQGAAAARGLPAVHQQQQKVELFLQNARKAETEAEKAQPFLLKALRRPSLLVAAELARCGRGRRCRWQYLAQAGETCMA